MNETSSSPQTLIVGGNQDKPRGWYLPIPDDVTRIKIQNITGEYSVLELVANTSKDNDRYAKIVGLARRLWNKKFGAEHTFPREVAGSIFFPLAIATLDGRVYAQRHHILAHYGNFDCEPIFRFLLDARMLDTAYKVQAYFAPR